MQCNNKFHNSHQELRRCQILLLLSSIIISALFTACKTTEEVEVIEQNVTEDNTRQQDLTLYTNDNGKYLTLPNYYVQDFEGVNIKSTPIKNKGTLIVELYSLYRYINGEDISLEEFIDKYSDKIKDNGEVDIEAVGSTFLENSNINSIEKEVIEEDFNILDVQAYLNNNYYVLVKIPHNSIYGKNLSYLIITAITNDGFMLINDANKYNIENYALGKAIDGRYMYSTGEVLAATGSDSKMYAFHCR